MHLQNYIFLEELSCHPHLKVYNELVLIHGQEKCLPKFSKATLKFSQIKVHKKTSKTHYLPPLIVSSYSIFQCSTHAVAVEHVLSNFERLICGDILVRPNRVC